VAAGAGAIPEPTVRAHVARGVNEPPARQSAERTPGVACPPTGKGTGAEVCPERGGSGYRTEPVPLRAVCRVRHFLQRTSMLSHWAQMDTQRCIDCRRSLSVENFDRNGAGRRRPECRECRRLRRRITNTNLLLRRKVLA
jgi:hypothetical protein